MTRKTLWGSCNRITHYHYETAMFRGLVHTSLDIKVIKPEDRKPVREPKVDKNILEWIDWVL